MLRLSQKKIWIFSPFFFSFSFHLKPCIFTVQISPARTFVSHRTRRVIRSAGSFSPLKSRSALQNLQPPPRVCSALFNSFWGHPAWAPGSTRRTPLTPFPRTRSAEKENNSTIMLRNAPRGKSGRLSAPPRARDFRFSDFTPIPDSGNEPTAGVKNALTKRKE